MSDDDRIPECDYCGDNRGMCDRPHLEDDRRFTIKLDETFDVFTVRNDDKSSLVIKHDFCFFASTCNFHFLQFDQCIPCHARLYVLEKLDFEDRDNMETKRVHLRTQHSYTFAVQLYNAMNHSYFGCSNWRALCKAYAFQEDMHVTFDIRPEDDIEDNIDIWVDVDTLPVLPLCEFVKHIY